MSSFVKATCILTAVALSAALLTRCRTSETPQQFVERFYTAYISIAPPGLPAGDDLERIAPFLSRRLDEQIRAALDYQQSCIRQHPDEKPPFVDGDHFSSLFEGPQSFQVTGVTEAPGGGWEVSVRFSYETENWEDRVLVMQENGRLVLDDVLYSGAGSFNPPGRLSERLRWREDGEPAKGR